MPPLAVRLRSAVAVLGRFPALAGVDLDVADGEILLVSGPNGAGKSTLLRVLAGLVPVTGEATVLGHDLVADRRSVRGEVGYLGHETLCYEDLTVTENLRFHARAAGRPGSLAVEIVERVGLGHRAGVPQRLLSAGQRRRLALGAVLVREPRLLLLDEPHAGLDASGRELLDDFIRAASSEGRTVLVASHEVERTRSLADREITMAGGHVHEGTATVDEAGPDAGPGAAPDPTAELAAAHEADAAVGEGAVVR